MAYMPRRRGFSSVAQSGQASMYDYGDYYGAAVTPGAQPGLSTMPGSIIYYPNPQGGGAVAGFMPEGGGELVPLNVEQEWQQAPVVESVDTPLIIENPARDNTILYVVMCVGTVLVLILIFFAAAVVFRSGDHELDQGSDLDRDSIGSGSQGFPSGIGSYDVTRADASSVPLSGSSGNNTEPHTPRGKTPPTHVGPPKEPKRGKTKTTTLPPAPIQLPPEVICTIGQYATAPLYPPDRLCLHLYYTNVFIASGIVRGTSDNSSWSTFKTMALKYGNTEAGIGFDITYVDSGLVQDATADLIELATTTNNIRHYGVLNVIGTANELPDLMKKAQGVLKELKILQDQDATRKTTLGVGLYLYSQDNALSEYKRLFIEAVNTYAVDTVIALSSVSAMVDDTDCTVVPPGISAPFSTKYPGIMQYHELVTTGTQYQKDNALVGLSLEMGALVYSILDGTKWEDLFSGLLACDGFSITFPDSVCSSNVLPNKTHDLEIGRVSSNTDKLLYIRENVESVHMKVQYVNRPWKDYYPRRGTIAWLVFNVHFDANVTNCNQAHKAFSRVSALSHASGQG